mgnify:CR=1 FL=1
MKKLIIATILLLLNGITVNIINAIGPITQVPKTKTIDEQYCVVLKEAQQAFDKKEAKEYINKLAEEQKENEAKAKEATTKQEKEEAAKEALDLEIKAQLINVIAKNVSDQIALDVIGRKKTQTEHTKAKEEYQEAQDIADAAKVTAKIAAKAVLIQQ